MTEQGEGKKNKWKQWFFTLLAFNIIVLFSLVVLIYWPVSAPDLPEQQSVQKPESSEFIIRTTKNNLTDLVNAYLDELLKNSKHQYQVVLEDDVHLVGELPAFSTTVPVSIRLEPIVQENGDVILKQKNISLGLLELPNQKIMGYMNKYLPLPEWVVINAKEEEIYVAVTEMDIRSNFEVSVEHIDLGANHLAFKLNVPYETLGIEGDSNK
ncbi:YpmS family protein [Ornithinibacillus halophilus]|uniref:Uncharacterized protein YpmS n=1 Tax=Ornithinibacillus halophilus TaxID=930117 RepID=A0A1M5JH96_9BACI|nr:YpmS family protein [Ornithinibacillus halophilus]SHG39640.1 Uncharacterized protein YpmS [Ornithinibacillus halophilus]